MSERDHVDALQEQIEDLQKRVSLLEGGQADVTASPAGGGSRFDAYDRAVVEVLQGNEGTIVHPRQLVELYRNNTSISREKTLRSRAESLGRSDLFENGSGRGLRFVGAGGSDE